MGANPTFARGKSPRRQSDPAWDGQAITPGTSELADWPRALYIGVGGTVVIVTPNDTELVLLNTQSGEIIPYVCKKVLAASTDSPPVSTTAMNILGMN